ncbi:hypothetical protein HDU81_000712, partial [Chytriomyces hyalinus]
MSTSQVPGAPLSTAGPASRAATAATFSTSSTAVIPSSTTMSARSPPSSLSASPIAVVGATSNGLSQNLVYIIAGVSAVVGVSVAVALFCCWRAKKRKTASSHDPPLSSVQLQAERAGHSGATRDQMNSSQVGHLLPSTTPERAPFLAATSDTPSNGGSSSGTAASSPTSSIPTLPDSVPSMSQSHSPESNDRLSVSADTLVKSVHSSGTSLPALAAASKSQLKYSMSVDEMSNASASISSRRDSLSRSANDVVLQYQKSYERAMSIHADSVYGEPPAIPNRNSASMGRSKSTIALNALSERSKSIPFKAAFIERVCEVVASSDELASQADGSLTSGFENDEKVVQFAQSFNRRYSSAYSAVEAMDEEAVRSRLSGAFILNQAYWHSEPAQTNTEDGEDDDTADSSTSDFDSESDDGSSKTSAPNGKQEAGRKSASLSLTPLRSSLIQNSPSSSSTTNDQSSYHQVYSSVSYYWSSPEFSAKWEAASSHLSNT